MLAYPFMQRALLAALLIGLAAPAVGTFIVQRRLALLGDGIGHIALTGVALGLVTSTSPLLGAIVVSVLGAICIELLRTRGRTGGDVALALLFYGGLAGGVLVTNFAPGGSTSSLLSYLFGSISSVSEQDLVVIALLVLAVLGVLLLFGRELFVLCQDEEVARASGLRVGLLSMMLAVIAALTIVVAMRVVGLLLVSALMVVPVAAAQQLTRGFKATAFLAMFFGVFAAVGGLAGSYQFSTGEVNISPGPAIVVVALAVFVLSAAAGFLARRRHARPLAGPVRSGGGPVSEETP